METYLLPALLYPAIFDHGTHMTGLSKPSAPLHTCPFCGVASDINHETQEGCIAALHAEIARMRGILSQLRPASAVPVRDDQHPARVARVTLD